MKKLNFLFIITAFFTYTSLIAQDTKTNLPKKLKLTDISFLSYGWGVKIDVN